MRGGVGKCVGCGGGKGRCKERWGEWGDVGKYVGAPHPNTLHYTSPIPLPTSLPLTPTHFLTHPTHFPIPHTSFLTHPHILTHFPTPPPTPLPTAPLTSPYTPTHFPTHPMHSPPQFGLCGEVTMWRCCHNKFNQTVKKPDKIFFDNREFKVLFWCRQCKFSMYESVAKLLWRSYWQPNAPYTTHNITHHYTATWSTVCCAINIIKS